MGLCLVLLVFSASCAGSPAKAASYPEFTGTITEVEKYGHTVTDVAVADMFGAGYAHGDILTVTFANGYTFDAPLVSAYDVERGQYLVRTEYGNGYVAACINYGDLAKEAGVGVGDTVTFSMKQKAGYLSQYEIRQLTRTDERSDYSSDAVFANFREVTAGSIAPGVLYRGSHPTKTEWPRAPYVSALMEKAGIRTVINMSDSEAELKAYLDSSNPYASSYYKKIYSEGNVICLSMGMTYTDPVFIDSMIKGLRFMLSHPAPYYLHCNEGKDRTGFIFILMEALMGATQEEITRDYMLSYVNYYGVEEGTAKYTVIADDNAVVMLKTITGTNTLRGTDFSKAAEAYLQNNGMTSAEITNLKQLLAGK
ncbi:tyrosine-protein phosphatase [Breznakiella homolactica]|uniref:Tyrosine-protein phosphatase n=1 Tax=Breznakiella homolactica TaxID=2798577 RepID=A0A7T7XRT4_9SPIR|nr:tyrosine-protein phosphatase [Breznakiella homolactica]